MKRNIETIEDPTIEPGMAIAEVYLQGQARPFTISGIAETVVAAAGRMPAVKEYIEPVAPEKPVVAAVREPQVVALHGREYVRATLKAKLFDMVYQTHEYDELERIRLLERRLRLRQELGTMPLDICRKHQHLVDALKR